MAVTTAVIITYFSKNNATASDIIGIQSGQLAKPATVADVGMRGFLNEVAGAGASNVTLVVQPDSLGNPDDYIQYLGGVGGSEASTSLVLTAATALSTEDANNLFGVIAGGGGPQPAGPELIGKVINYLQNLGQGMNAAIVISQGLGVPNADQWQISAGGTTTV